MTRRRRRDSRRGRGWRGTAWGQLPRGLRGEGQLRWPVRGRCLERARPVEPGCPSGGGGYPLSGAASWRGEPRRGGGGVAVADSWGSRMEADLGRWKESRSEGLARRWRARPHWVRLDSCGVGCRLPSQEVSRGRRSNARAQRENWSVQEV